MSLSTKLWVNILEDYYKEYNNLLEHRKYIAYCSVFAPIEILRALDIICVYPENYSVLCSGLGLSKEMIESSAVSVHSHNLCSYYSIFSGTKYYLKNPYGGLPKPDMIVATNNQCGTILPWFRDIAEEEKVPLFFIDYPGFDGSKSVEIYIHEQHKALISQIEKLTGNTLKFDKLASIVENSRVACNLWQRFHSINKQKPSKISINKYTNALFPIVVARGSEEACKYYSVLLNEYLSIPKKITEDKKRLLWHGYPLWYLNNKVPILENQNVEFVLNDYTLWWDLKFEKNFKIENLANTYNNTYLNWNINKKTNWILQLIFEYNIDGVILHSNRSCKRFFSSINIIYNVLQNYNIPSLIIEADMADSRVFSDENIQLRIESFLENLL